MIEIEVGLDTAPAQYPRSNEYHKEGMDFEGWELRGDIFFGMSLYYKKVETEEEAQSLKAEAGEKCKRLYNEGFIRGARWGIVRT